MPGTGRIHEVNWSKRLFAASSISVLGLLSVGLLGGYTIFTQNKVTQSSLATSRVRADAASKAEIAVLSMGKAQSELILAKDPNQIRNAAISAILASSVLDESIQRLDRALPGNPKVRALSDLLKQIEPIKMRVIQAAKMNDHFLAEREAERMRAGMTRIEEVSGELVAEENDSLLKAVEHQGRQAEATLVGLGALVLLCIILSLVAGSELRRRTLELAKARIESELFINNVPSILIGIDDRGRIVRWNQTATAVFGLSKSEVETKPLENCGVKWLQGFDAEIRSWLNTTHTRHYDDLSFEKSDKHRFITLTVNPILFDRAKGPEFLITGADITERRSLEEELRQAHKLEAIGQLAAGVAHEINTPVQYVTDNTRFVNESWAAVDELLSLSWQMADSVASVSGVEEAREAFRKRCEDCDISYLKKEVPSAIEQSMEGLDRIAKIVRAMKEFSHPGSAAMQQVDINRAIELTVTVAASEWRHVAEVKTEFDRAMPAVTCNAGEFNQVILNLLINASHAVADAANQPGGKGVITISTKWEGDWAEVQMRDSGTGIPEEIGNRIFDPFFTTKEVGKGTGQGLAMAHASIVKKHSGKIWFESEPGKGTTFFIRLPLEQSVKASA